MNLYGPYGGRKTFWEGIGDSSILKGENVIIGGDINLTLNKREIWGEIARKDTLIYFFSHFFEAHKLIDVELVKLFPTWKNDRRGRSGISKRLIDFMLLIKSLLLIRQ